MGRLAALGEPARAIPVCEHAVTYNELRVFKPTTIEDARGRRIDFLQDFEWSEAEVKLSKDEYREIVEVHQSDILGEPHLTLRSRIGPRELFSIIAGSIPFLVYLILRPLLIPAGSSLLWDIVIIFACSMCASPFLLFWVKWQCRSLNQDRPFPRTVLGFGRCPACMYSLAELPAESDGCTVCPECGGAWRLTVTADGERGSAVASAR
jgi:hypothetical protein